MWLMGLKGKFGRGQRAFPSTGQEVESMSVDLGVREGCRQGSVSTR